MKYFRGSVTVFLALSLSAFLLLLMTLLSLCIRTGEYVRFETASDVSLNSVLGEYNRALFDEFGLLYVDASYLRGEPSIERVEDRIDLYMRKNTTELYESENGPWGGLDVKDSEIVDFGSATAGQGKSLRNQINQYGRRIGFSPESEEAVSRAAGLNINDNMQVNLLEYWNGIKETLAGMEKPKIKDSYTGIEKEAEVDDPADIVYGMSGSDILFLSKTEIGSISGLCTDTSFLISRRPVINIAGRVNSSCSNEECLKYLSDKFGCFQKEKGNRVLNYEIEYILFGNDSDSQNFREAIDKLYRIRMSDNLRIAQGDGNLCSDAENMAGNCFICSLNPDFIEPITQSIICGCAFLETVGDMEELLSGGRVPFHKEHLLVKVNDILSASIPSTENSDGLSYKEYLLAMTSELDEIELNYKIMDLIELEIRKENENPNFSMDWCVERIDVNLQSAGSKNNQMNINRTYGFY